MEGVVGNEYIEMGVEVSGGGGGGKEKMASWRGINLTLASRVAAGTEDYL